MESRERDRIKPGRTLWLLAIPHRFRGTPVAEFPGVCMAMLACKSFTLCCAHERERERERSCLSRVARHTVSSGFLHRARCTASTVVFCMLHEIVQLHDVGKRGYSISVVCHRHRLFVVFFVVSQLGSTVRASRVLRCRFSFGLCGAGVVGPMRRR